MNKFFRYIILIFIMGVLSYAVQTSDGQENKAMTVNSKDIRPPELAGTWYEGDPMKLYKEIESYLKEAGLVINVGTIIGIISPHAGIRYSGPVAAAAYRQVHGMKFDTIIVVGPNHASSLNFSSVYTRGGYESFL